MDCICKLLEDNTEKNGTIILKKTERSFKGLLRQWQDVMHLITKRLELSQTLAKIMADIKRLEDEVGKVLMGRPPPPVIHNKQDLQKDIDDLKVGLYIAPQIDLQLLWDGYTGKFYFSISVSNFGLFTATNFGF